jgi:hypothetical protein
MTPDITSASTSATTPAPKPAATDVRPTTTPGSTAVGATTAQATPKNDRPTTGRKRGRRPSGSAEPSRRRAILLQEQLHAEVYALTERLSERTGQRIALTEMVHALVARALPQPDDVKTAGEIIKAWRVRGLDQLSNLD